MFITGDLCNVFGFSQSRFNLYTFLTWEIIKWRNEQKWAKFCSFKYNGGNITFKHSVETSNLRALPYNFNSLSMYLSKAAEFNSIYIHSVAEPAREGSLSIIFSSPNCFTSPNHFSLVLNCKQCKILA